MLGRERVRAQRASKSHKPKNERKQIYAILVLVRRLGRRALWPASNLHETRRRQNRRWPRWIYRRSDRCDDDPSLSCLATFRRDVESNVVCARRDLLCANRDLRRCRDRRVLPALSERRAALCRADGARGRGGVNGHCRHPLFQGERFRAAIARNFSRAGGFVSPANGELIPPFLNESLTKIQ